jgi:hypothetical protein
MAGERIFVVKILGDAGSAVAAFKKLQTEGEKATGALGIQSKQLEGVFKQVTIAAAAGFASGVALMTSSIQAAIQAQAEQTRLATILRQTVDASDAQIASLNSQAEALQKVGVVSAGTTSVVQSQLATFDLSVDTIKRLTPAILDYVTAEKGATASTEEFKSMTNGLAQALQGNFASLTKSGFVLDANTKELIKNGTEAQRSAALVTVLNSTYEGFNATLRDTPEGQMQALKNSVNDLQTAFGQLLLPALSAILPLFQSLAELAQRHSTIFGALVITFTAVAGAVLLYATYLKLLPIRILAVASAQAILNFAMTANPIGLVIVAVGLLVVAFIKLTGSMDKVVSKTIETVNAFNKLVNLFLPDMLEIPMMNVAKATSQITEENRRAIQVANQTERAYLGVAGSLREILSVPIAKQLQTQTDRLTGLARSLGVAYVSYGQFDKATGGASKTVETAAQKMKKYTDAVKSSTAAQKSFTSAQKDSDRAFTSLLDAQDDVRKKQKALNDAVNGYGADSEQAKKAQRELAQAERGVAEAGFRVEESVFAVRDAEKKLADLRKDPTTSAQEIRLAEIDLAKAKLAVADATDSEFDATNKLKDAQLLLNEAVNGAIEGSETYLGFAKELEDAQLKAFDASERLADAKDREAEAYERLAEAIDSATQAAINANKTVELIPKLPSNPTSGGGGTAFGGKSDPGVQIVVNTGIGTNGIEAGRQIVQLLQQYTAVDAFAIDRLGFAPRR